MQTETWETTFEELFARCVERYRSGDENYEGYYSEEDRAFLDEIGYKPREFFDFVEDFCDEGVPTPEKALEIAGIRREYFLREQGGKRSEGLLVEAALPARDSELAGMRWLPRIIAKARAKLRGELDPEIMFSCGGDRNFLGEHSLDAAKFLRAVWEAGEDDEKIVSWVEENRG